MPLSEMERVEVASMAELEVRRYMDALYDRYLPKVIEAAVSAHNADVEAHEAQIAAAVNSKFDRVKFLLLGLTFGAGAGVGTVIKALLEAL